MDGAWIASASADKTVKVWRAADGRCLATLSGHLLSVSSVAFSSDARRIASGSWDKTVCIWDVEQGRAVLTLTGHADWVHSVAWAPGSHQVASASSDHSVRVWSTISGVVEQVLVGHLQTVSSVSFARSGVFLASGSLDGTVRVWNLQEGTLAARLEQDSSVHSVAFSPDSEHIVVGCRESLVKVWSFRNGEQEAQLSGHEESVQCVATSLDGSVAASCSHDKTLRVWRLPKRQTQKVSAMQRTPLGGLRQVISPEPSLQELQEQLKRSDEVNQHLRKQLLQAATVLVVSRLPSWFLLCGAFALDSGRSQFENFCKATAGACRDGAGALIQLQKMKVLALTGARRPGGGRKDSFLHIKLRVKSWLEKERSMCHHVEKADLVEEFLDQCRDESEAAEKEQAKRQVPEEKMEDKEEEQGKKGASREALLQKLVEGSNEVSVAAGYEDMKSPEEAVASLSPGELKVWDTLLKGRVTKLKSSSKYFATFGDRLVEQIGAKVLKPGRMSTLSMDEEEARVKAGWKDFDAAMWLAAFSPEAELEKWVANPGDFMERRHECVLGFSDQIPVWIKIGRKKQVYCSKEVGKRKTTGKWKEDERYQYGGKLIERKAGKCVGMILKSWVQMRKRKPELFENWEVYSQPGAVVDPIIQSWELEEQSEEFPCSVWCRDMLASGYTVECRMKQSVAQQIPCQVKAGVTPIVQLTDTDFGFSFKASLAAAHVEMRQEMKAKARRNGYFHWRPCWKQDCLVEASLQDWCQELPEGSYRYPSHWLEERGSWLKEGVPKMSALKDLEDAVTRAKDAEEYFCRSEGFLFRVASMKGLKLEEHHGVIECDAIQDGNNEELEGASLDDIMDSKQKRRIRKALKLDDDEKLEMPAVDDKKEQDQEKLQMEKLKKKHTMHVLMQKSKEKFRVMMQTMTRKEAIQSLLTAGGKKKKTKVQKQQKQMMKSNVKGKFMTKVKASLKKDPSSVEKKPCAKKKPSQKNKPSVKNKRRSIWRRKVEAVEEIVEESETGKRKLLNSWLEKQQQKMLKENGAEAREELEEELRFAEADTEGVSVFVVHESAGREYFGRQGILKEARFGGEGEPEVSLHFNPGVWSCLLKHTVEVEQGKKTRKLKGFNEVSRVMLQSWLWDCGLKLEPEDPGDDVTVSSQGGDWLLDQRLNVGWELLKFGAGLQESAVQYVPPDLLQAWMHLETEGAHPDADEEFLLRLAAVQENRRKVIVQKLDKAAVVLMPVYCSQHWTLVVVQKVGDEVLVEYRDSLKTASEESWQAAAKALKVLKGWELPRRCNTAVQPPGSALCGAFVLFWMEQVCRKQCLNEPACSMGWPNAALWSARTWTVSKMLKKEQDKQIAEAKALQLKNEAIRKKRKAVDEKNIKKQEQLEKITGKVEASAKESWLKVPAGKPCLENLSKEGQLDVADKANTGQGSCSRCRWGDVGCLSCSGAKALEYWVKKEGFYDEF
ncbi:unnamed protein product [Polarella glacialis]|uniref:Ubiquitin-like protease family profile domain-containing protein n=1 Tax=Polarella glacialis TaxID=89957 RepID=A0A813M7W2_POLGL|nr:unnamed protein product [Polarella glacialis]